MNRSQYIVTTSSALGGGFGALLYSDGAALLPTVLASVVAALVVYIAQLPNRIELPAEQPEESHDDCIDSQYQFKIQRIETDQPVVEPVQQVERKKITRINPDYYRPEVALSRFTPANQTAIVGVGCAGINAVNHLVDSGLNNADTVSIDTDLQKLHHAKSDCSIFIGDQKDRVPDLLSGSMRELSQSYRRAETVVLLVGMGGKTGTVVAPALAKAAKRSGKTVHLFAVEPFAVEGRAKSTVASSTLKQLESEIDSVVSLSNEELNGLVTDDGSMVDAFNMANEVMRKLVDEAVVVGGV